MDWIGSDWREVSFSFANECKGFDVDVTFQNEVLRTGLETCVQAMLREAALRITEKNTETAQDPT